MASQLQTRKSELIDKATAFAHDKLDKENAEATAEFVRDFYANVPPDDLSRIEPSDLFGAAFAFRRFATDRKAGEHKVRVYNPSFDEHGWRSVHTVVEIVNDDMPFLVDSVTAELNRRDLTVHLVIHPIFEVTRDNGGTLTEVRARADRSNGAASESFMHIEIDEQSATDTLDEIKNAIDHVLTDVRFAVADWQDMRGRLKDTVAELKKGPGPIADEDIDEAKAFLEWLDDNHFTFLGYREYVVVGKGDNKHMEVAEDSGLGMLRDADIHVFEGVRRLADLPADVRDFLEHPQLLIINKANMRSTVHRAVHLDAIGIKSFDKKGQVVRERLFVGLFTSTVYNRSPIFIPILRKKVNRIIEQAGFDPSSHDGKALLHILETFPRDEFFQSTEAELQDISLGILHLQERQRTALFVRRDSFERFVSCLVYVPRDRHDTSLRRRFQNILESVFGGPVTAFYTQISEDSVLARIHFIVKTEPGAVPEYDIQDVERRLVEASRSWSDDLRDTLIQDRGEDRGLQILRRYGEAFPTAYRERFDAHYALVDIARIEETKDGRLALNLYRPIEAAESHVRLKIYNPGGPVPLSDVLPVLENMGLKVMDELPYHVQPGDGEHVHIHDFGVVMQDGSPIALGEVRDAFHDAFARIWRGEMDNDGFNRLVIGGGLHWREIMVLRAFAKYLRQAAIPFSQAYMEETLSANVGLAKLVLDLFRARFDPDGASVADEDRIVAKIESALDAVDSLDQDRIIRRFVNLIQAALRTNFFQRDEAGQAKPYLSFKFASTQIDELPLPHPFAEIFVYSPRMEGVHLRGGLVARGGLRWSDRREDFRTEILGLMKAQMVKNAVIVPVGSKGGFVVKRPPADGNRDALLEEGIACYKTLLRGMLDLTDNRVGDDIVPPDRVVRHDGDDPYLVVAADKGTATFSDYANEVSDEYGFWLRDAYASGGSAGYDHKKMGITARGAWEAVKRHFRELGKDIQTQDFTVVGIGDMSGDVFGNGMLLSEHIKLIGAFNHLHIFVDPKPDPAKSFAERKRMFELPRSSWADYDAKLISKGGGIFERRAKSIPVSAEMKSLFGLRSDKVTPNDLIRAMLKAEMELLWFGGIGTYIKHKDETHGEAGDRTNDALRIDAHELKAKVVGEGANLGVTQRGRIAFAQSGGRINSDAIDNSAGVDCSDHEVNIKILLGQVVDAGDMTIKQRNGLLETMTDEVAALVLRDNYLQTQAISQVEALGVTRLEAQVQFMRLLEREGRLNRAIEDLPDDEELAEREAAHQGLTRPEVAVLLAYAKIALYDALLDSDLPDDPLLEADLARYFPEPLQEAYAEAIANHRLRREIVATFTTNSIVNRAGPTFVRDLVEHSGRSSVDVARAYLMARDSFRVRELWTAIEGLDNAVPAQLQTEMALYVRTLIERATMWFLRTFTPPVDVREVTETYAPAIAVLWDSLDDVLTDDAKAHIARRKDKLIKHKVPEDLAGRIASLDVMASACDVVRLAEGRAVEAKAVGGLYFSVGARFAMDWLRTEGHDVGAGDYWGELAAAAIVDDLFAHQYRLTEKLLELSGGTVELADGVVEAWVGANAARVERVERLMEELRATDGLELAKLAVANRQLRELVAG